MQKLLDRLSTLLPGSAYRADGNYVADGVIKSSLSVKTNWPTKFLQAAWNWQFVNVEGSKGVHNAPYAVGVLKASIADLTGDANNDGLSDAWQIQYFGSASNPNAAPNATALGGSTNLVHIYTAAEVAFDTEVGRTYQIQSVSSLSGGWQNIGGPIPGTGRAISYVTPTRSNAQQFYRVTHTP